MKRHLTSWKCVCSWWRSKYNGDILWFYLKDFDLNKQLFCGSVQQQRYAHQGEDMLIHFVTLLYSFFLIFLCT